MVDVLVDGSISTIAENEIARRGPVWTNDLIGYLFYVSNIGDNGIRYRKTINGGLTWGAEVTVSVSTDGREPAVWYDRWTQGDSGTLIGIAYYTDGDGDIHFRTLDTATDILDVQRTIFNGVPGDLPTNLGLVKAVGGNYYVPMTSNSAGMQDRFFRSTDGGVNWVERITVQDTGLSDSFIVTPGNEADSQDIYLFQCDFAAQEITLKVYDDSTNTFSETLIVAAYRWFTIKSAGASQRHSDGHSILVMYGPIPVAATNDIRVFDVNGAASIVEKTQVITDVAGLTAEICIDQNTDDLYVPYFRGPNTTTQQLFFKVSRDGGTTWEAEQAYSVFSGEARLLMSGTSISGPGRFEPSLIDDAAAPGRDLYVNVDNSIVLGLPAPGPPVPPPEIVPPGGSYMPSPGAAPGTVVAITPDGEEFELMSPGIGEVSGTTGFAGRYMMSFSGFGLAPIQYVSQRGPNQDGETVRDFHLTPRVVQLLERAQFRSRGEWWDGRADILNHLRPNRQLVATDTVPFVLRIVTTNGDIRDLHVFIQEGPLFEPRNVDEWDEWAWQEVLRFIAHDPLWFDPAQVSLSLAIGLSDELVFPITFPIEFGGGAIDVTTNLDYVGTWATLPTIVIVGPLDGPIIDNETTGEKIQLDRAIGPDRTVTIDLAFGQKTIVDDLGNNLLGSLSTDSDLGTFHIAATPEATQVLGQPRPTGRNVIRLRGANPTGSTSVVFQYYTRYFGI